MWNRYGNLRTRVKLFQKIKKLSEKTNRRIKIRRNLSMSIMLKLTTKFNTKRRRKMYSKIRKPKNKLKFRRMSQSKINLRSLLTNKNNLNQKWTPLLNSNLKLLLKCKQIQWWWEWIQQWWCSNSLWMPSSSNNFISRWCSITSKPWYNTSSNCTSNSNCLPREEPMVNKLNQCRSLSCKCHLIWWCLMVIIWTCLNSSNQTNNSD